MLREREVPVILAGDLDADPSAASIRFLTGRQSLHGLSVCYRDAWDSAHPDDAGHTYTPVNPLMVEDWPFRRIDYILVRCAEHGGPMLAVTDCRRLFDRPVDGVWASDHFGLVADLVPHRGRSSQLHVAERAGASPGFVRRTEGTRAARG
jgi:endonuclease/exonuclease/phosphatase family metal-dependent hydrolase